MFEKSSVIQQPNAFKSQRPSILGKQTILSDSLERKDFSKSKSDTKNNVSNDFSKPVTAQILPPNKKSILKNINVLAPGMYKLHTKPNQTRTTQLPHDLRKTNKRMSFSTGVILTTSVSRPQLKSNQIEDRVMPNNSQGKKQEVEEHRKNVKFSKNKTSITACNDSLNAKTSNVNFVCATCGQCVLNVKHDMCILRSRTGENSSTKMPIVVPVSTREPKRIVKQSIAKPLRKPVALKSTNQKPRNITRKLYEHAKIILFIFDSGCSKHMTGNLKLLINFMEKFLGTVKFRNDQIAPILGYGDLVQGAVTIKMVYYVEGLNHNLFSVGQFCDADLEVAFRKSTCYICDLKGNDLLTGSRETDLYSITLQDTSSPNLICLMAKATSSQAWLWHRRLSHLNFDTINLLSKYDIVNGLPKLKVVKDHLCSSCELGKAKRKYTWTHFLRSKDETPKVLIDFLRLVQRGLHAQLVEIVLFIVDSGCSKHMTGNLKLLINFVEKFLGTVKFGNDQIAHILGYGDLVQGAITIKRVYYVEGLNHNLFSVGQFCDADLEVAFRKSTCFIRDLKGNDLLSGSRETDLYSITLQDTNSPNPICLVAKATSSQAWLWHRRLSHLNFDTINLLSKNDIVVDLPKVKFVKDHLCSSCELGKAKRKSFHTKLTPSSKRRLQLLHMDLCGPMRVASINGKRYVLVIVDDYSRYTWTHFLRSKDETPKVLIDFLRLIQRGLQAQVRVVRTDKGTEFLNQTLHVYFAAKGIQHQTSIARTPEQNDVIKRRNRTLVEAARKMLSATKVPLFFWAEAMATACFTQNRSLVIPRHEKTPYHIINDRKPSVKFFHIFGSVCYIVRDGENLDKIKDKGDECIFVGYSTQSRAYRVFNKRTRVIMESIHVNFDELPLMASDQNSSDPAPKCQTMALNHVSLSPVIQRQRKVTQADRTVTTSNELDLLFSPIFDELLNGSSKVVSKYFAVSTADATNQRQQYTTPLKNHTTPTPTCQIPTLAPTVISSENINQAETYAKNDQVADDEFINIFSTPVQDQEEKSSRHVDSSNMHTFYQRFPSE
nr:retrovirus-related Pol polyprotein from transposon TNT 1-94 [Tanacetum cinerariifolium]